MPSAPSPLPLRVLVTFHPDLGVDEEARELRRIKDEGFDGVRTIPERHLDRCRELGLRQLAELYFTDSLDRVGPDGWARRAAGGLGRIPYRDHTHCAANPAIVAAGEDGARAGVRKHRDSPVPIAFQVDNEFSYLDLEDTTQYLCYCPACQTGFRDFLRERFGELSRLNAAWKTGYRGWEEIPLPIKPYRVPWRRKEDLPPWMEFRRFTNRAIARYICRLCAAARAETDKPIVIAEMNTMFFDGCVHVAQDLYAMSREADVLGLNIGGCDFAEIVDFTRGFGKELWLTESHIETSILHSRLMRQRHYSAIGHGCRTINFFKSRASMEGVERDGFGMTREDGRPVQLQFEVEEVAAELKRLAPELGTARHAQPRTAIVYSWETMFANDYFERTLGGRGLEMTAISALHGAYRAARALHVPVELATTDQMAVESLAKYRALILPACLAFPTALAGPLLAWVSRGGSLIVEYPFARFDERGVMDAREPGSVWEPLGIETSPLQYGRHDLAGQTGVFPAVGERARILKHAGEVLATFRDGETAAVRIPIGKGQCIFLAASPSVGMKNFPSSTYPEFLQAFLPRPPVRLELPAAIAREMDAGLLACEDKAVVVLVNYNEAVVKDIPIRVRMDELGGRAPEVWMYDQEIKRREKLRHSVDKENDGERVLSFTVDELDTSRVVQIL